MTPTTTFLLGWTDIEGTLHAVHSNMTTSCGLHMEPYAQRPKFSRKVAKRSNLCTECASVEGVAVPAPRAKASRRRRKDAEAAVPSVEETPAVVEAAAPEPATTAVAPKEGAEVTKVSDDVWDYRGVRVERNKSRRYDVLVGEDKVVARNLKDVVRVVDERLGA